MNKKDHLVTLASAAIQGYMLGLALQYNRRGANFNPSSLDISQESFLIAKTMLNLIESECSEKE